MYQQFLALSIFSQFLKIFLTEVDFREDYKLEIHVMKPFWC